MAETVNPAKKMPKGGRKGGTLFPKINLKLALDYSKKLVAKTHTGPQPAKIILPGVFGSATGPGRVRASALKQFGLLEGEADAYQATQLAKEIDGTPTEDRTPLLQRAFTSSKLFKDVLETFRGDTVSKAKIEQRARGLDVHPDSADECAQLFIDSAVTAGLGTVAGESIVLETPTADVSASGIPVEADATEELAQVEDTAESGSETPIASKPKVGANELGSTAASSKPTVTVNLNVDSSSDPDKLEKQLKLLRGYGVI